MYNHLCFKIGHENLVAIGAVDVKADEQDNF